QLSRIIFGCMSYGTPGWRGQMWVLEENEGLEKIKFAFVPLSSPGINAFDTAAVYSDGASEEILGKAIKQYNLPRDEIVVMTKVFGYTAWNRPKDDEPGARTVNQKGLSRKHIFDSVKHSLERLQLDYIDLLQCHRFDYETPIEETMQALHDVVQAGYVRYIGMSSCWAWQCGHCFLDYAISNKLTPFVSMQNHHQENLKFYIEEREMFPTCKHFGVGIIPWYPLARGMLTRPLAVQKNTARGTGDPFVDRYNSLGGAADIINRVEEVAKKRGVSMAQVALAWSLGKEGVTSPIIGTTSIQKIIDCISAVHLQLAPEEMKYLEEPYLPSAVVGHT
ncbi:aryl-alcohol dehydrogenase, partial [Mycena capillaripes]